jgi:hypothetical protein
MRSSRQKTAGFFDPAAPSTLTLRLTRLDANCPVAPALNSLARLLLRRCRFLLLDRPLQFQCARREHLGAGFQQKRVEAAIVVDALDRVGGDAQAHVLAQRVRDEGDVAEVRQEPPLGLDVGVAHLVARLGALGRQFTAPRHLSKSSSIPLNSVGPVEGAAGVKNHGSRAFLGPTGTKKALAFRSDALSCADRDPPCLKTLLTGSGGRIKGKREGVKVSTPKKPRANAFSGGISEPYPAFGHHIKGVFGRDNRVRPKVACGGPRRDGAAFSGKSGLCAGIF